MIQGSYRRRVIRQFAGILAVTGIRVIHRREHLDRYEIGVIRDAAPPDGPSLIIAGGDASYMRAMFANGCANWA